MKKNDIIQNTQLLIRELSDLVPYSIDYGSVNGQGFMDLESPVTIKINGYSLEAASIFCDGYSAVVADEDGNQYDVKDLKLFSSL